MLMLHILQPKQVRVVGEMTVMFQSPTSEAGGGEALLLVFRRMAVWATDGTQGTSGLSGVEVETEAGLRSWNSKRKHGWRWEQEAGKKKKVKAADWSTEKKRISVSQEDIWELRKITDS